MLNWVFLSELVLCDTHENLDTYRRYLRDDTSTKVTIYRIVAVQNTVKRHKYRAYRRYRAARI